MPDTLFLLVLVALVVVAALVVAVLARIGSLSGSRDAAAREAAELRTRLEVLAAASADFERDLRQDFANARTEQAATAQAARTELGTTLAQQARAVQQQLAGMAGTQVEQLKQFGDRLTLLTQTNEQRLEAVRATVEQRLDVLRSENAQKLDQMRATVDEKLQTTLETRLGESFKQVSERLEQVYKGLGEMRTLATGVGDLKKVLTNVKTRGTWGEIQLGAILEQILSPDQYEANVATKKNSQERVEFAIKLPGQDPSGQHVVWMPIDAKFPQEDYQRLIDAQEAADKDLADKSLKNLEMRIKAEAKNIREKYIDPPNTTDFAVMFLPIEGLFAEVIRRPGLCDILQREYRVIVTGPTTLAALLNSLQMGFRTLAIEKRSSEIWVLLGAVKAEFGRFGDVLAKTKKKLLEATDTIDSAETRTRAIERKLRSVQETPSESLALPAQDVNGDSLKIFNDRS